MGRVRQALALTIVTIMSVPAPAGAQYNTAELSGVVKDEKGGVLPGANVVALHAASGRRSERLSDSAGRFTLPALPVGDYQVFVELAGFKRFEQHGLTLNGGQKIELAIVLELGQLSDAVTVTAQRPASHVERRDRGGHRQPPGAGSCPLNGRQFIQLAQLTDGVTIPPGGTRGAALGQAGPLPNVYGQRGGHNIYLIDGVKVTDEYFNNLVISPSVDAIQEFKIQKTMYPAEFGGKASALINVVTKSGSNRVPRQRAGVRAQRARSTPATTSTIQPSRCRRSARTSSASTSAARSSAIETFFFFSYEGQRIRKAQTQTFSVPTAALRGGDFSGLARRSAIR